MIFISVVGLINTILMLSASFLLPAHSISMANVEGASGKGLSL